VAIQYTAVILSKSYGFDFIDKRIDIDATLDELNVNDLYDAIQEAQASEQGITFPTIATAEGLTTLSAGILTFITVSLLSTWEINTLKSSGTFTVIGGNLVRADEAPPFRENPLVTFINNLSQAGIQSQQDVVFLRVLEMWQRLGLDVSNSLAITDSSINVGDVSLSIADDGTTTTVTRS